MNIFVTGINYKNTNLEIREKLSFNKEEQQLLVSLINKLPLVDECVLLSTCNRTEAYIYSNCDDFDCECVEKFLCEFKKLSIHEFKKYFYNYTSQSAVKHLFRVTCGLDSLVLGEDQILGQVKTACELSIEMGTSSSLLNTLFRNAITVAKKIKTQTDLSKNSVSIASVAVKFISNLFEDNLSDKCALIIGAGEIGSIALKNLQSANISKIYVTVRNHGKCNNLIDNYNNIQLVDYNDRYNYITQSDIIISCTSSPHYTITCDVLEKNIIQTGKKVFVDLAVPRDIDASISNLHWVEYFNIDHLKATVDNNINKRISEGLKAEEIINTCMLDYEKWYEFRSVLGVVKDVQEYTKKIVEKKVDRAISKIKNLSEEDKNIIASSFNNFANGILDKFIYNVRECSNKEDIKTYFKCIKEVLQD